MVFQKTESRIERFFGHVAVAQNGCWEWTGSHVARYAQFSSKIDRKKRSLLAHRYAYTCFKGAIPEGLTIDHLCRNTYCVNPAHLEAVSIKENILRGFGPPALNKRKTHCLHDHVFDEANTAVIGKKKERRCRQCSLESSRKLQHWQGNIGLASEGTIAARKATCAARTECRNGHAYTKENTLLRNGVRRCRTCRKIWERRKEDV